MPTTIAPGILDAEYSTPTSERRGALSLLRELARRPVARTRTVRVARPLSDRPGDRPADPSERARLARLRAIDGEVKAHEAAHLASLGASAGGPVHYDYVMGPDGNFYAVGGSIPVNLQPVPGNPEATLRKARTIIAAAFAPGGPSGADLRVAAAAYQLEMDAKREIAREEARRESRRRTDLFV